MKELRKRFNNMSDAVFDANKDQIERAFGSLNKKRSPSKHQESVIQTQCVKWFDAKYPNLWRFLFMIKNDGAKKKVQSKSGSWFSPSAVRDKSMGLRPGVSDLFLSIPSGGYHGLYIEMKTETGSQSAEQSAFEKCMLTANYRYEIRRSVSGFEKLITEYLSKADQQLMGLWVE